MLLNTKFFKVLLILSFFLVLAFSATATPTQTKATNQKSSSTPLVDKKQKSTLGQNITNYIFKKKLKKQQLKKQKRQGFELLSILSPIFAVLAIATLIGSWVASFALVEAGVIIFAVLTFLFSLGAILMGRKARKNIDNGSGKKGRGLAMAGIILGSVIGILFIINLILAATN